MPRPRNLTVKLATVSMLSMFSFLCIPVVPAAAVGDSVRDLRKELRAEIAAQNPKALARLLHRLAGEKLPEHVPLVFEGVIGLPTKEVVDAGLKALFELGSKPMAPFVERLLRDKRVDPLTLAFAMRAVAQFEDEQSEHWLLRCLELEQPLAQRHAIDALDVRRSKAAIPLLIALIEKDGADGSTRAYEARLALKSLTGHDYVAPEDWRKLWEGSADLIDPRNLERKDDGNTVVLARKNSPAFFGLEVISTRVLFVVDTSASMRKYDDDAATEEPDAGWEQKQRLYRTKWHFAKAIHKMPRDTKFSVIAFNTDVKQLSKKLVPATKAWKKKARDFIYDVKGEGQTNTLEAFKEAFRYTEIDTILFLSDGAPEYKNKEPWELMPKIENYVLDQNALRRINIFTFGFEGIGKWPPGGTEAQGPVPGALDFLGFMRRLAYRNGGKYTRIE